MMYGLPRLVERVPAGFYKCIHVIIPSKGSFPDPS